MNITTCCLCCSSLIGLNFHIKFQRVLIQWYIDFQPSLFWQNEGFIQEGFGKIFHFSFSKGFKDFSIFSLFLIFKKHFNLEQSYPSYRLIKRELNGTYYISLYLLFNFLLLLQFLELKHLLNSNRNSFLSASGQVATGSEKIQSLCSST